MNWHESLLGPEIQYGLVLVLFVEFAGYLLEIRVLNNLLFLVLILCFLEHHTDKGVAISG